MGKEKWMKDILTIPNALSLVRILLTIGFCITYFTEEKLAALVILVISGITDVLDGQIARKYHQISARCWTRLQINYLRSVQLFVFVSADWFRYGCSVLLF